MSESKANLADPARDLMAHRGTVARDPGVDRRHIAHVAEELGRECSADVPPQAQARADGEPRPEVVARRDAVTVGMIGAGGRAEACLDGEGREQPATRTAFEACGPGLDEHVELRRAWKLS